MFATNGVIVIGLACALAAHARANEPRLGARARPARSEDRETDRGGDRRIVLLRTDAARHAAWLAELAQARLRADAASFLAALDAGRAEIEARHAPLREWLAQRGAAIEHDTWLVEALVLSSVDDALEHELAAQPWVLELQRDPRLRPQLEQACDAQHHDAIGAHALDVGGVPLEGSGVVIAIVDSGIDANMAGSGRPHANFYPHGDPLQTTTWGIGGSRILSLVDLYAADGSLSAEDVQGHGTRMSSVCAGADWGAPGNVANGCAPAAPLRIYKISDDASAFAFAFGGTIAAGVQAAATTPDVRCINLSYQGSPNPQALLEKMLDAAVSAGVFVSVIAGNQGADLAGAHGSYGTLVVGGAKESVYEPFADPQIYTSAIGPLPDGRRYPHLLAQGSYLSCAKLDDEATSWESFGSSPASAFACGSAALVLQARPELHPLEVKALLLNTVAPAGGDPNAKGWGYLKTKLAVEDALAARVVQEAIQTGQSKSFDLALHAGELVSLTLTWGRSGLALSTLPGTAAPVPDLDLELVDPSTGSVWLASTSAVDTIEQLRFVAPLTQTCTVRVRANSGPSGDDVAPFALAGVTSHSVDDGAGCAFAAAASIASIEPSPAPTVALGPNRVTAHGCGLAAAQSITLDGQPLFPGTFSIASDNALVIELPPLASTGTHALELVTTSGAHVSASFEAVPPAALLGFNFPIDAQSAPIYSFAPLLATIGGTPGRLAFVCMSPSAAPSSLPGIVELAIGAGFNSLFVLTVDALPASGWLQRAYPFVGGLPFGTKIYFQSALYDPVSAVLPALTSNVASGTFQF